MEEWSNSKLFPALITYIPLKITFISIFLAVYEGKETVFDSIWKIIDGDKENDIALT